MFPYIPKCNAYDARKNGREIDFILDKTLALETKETPTAPDQSVLSKLASSAGIPSSHLIGRHSSPSFSDYLWGGDIH